MKRLATIALAVMAVVAAAATVYAVAVVEGAAGKEGGVKPDVHKSAYAGWGNGPPTDPDFFPIAVWMQAPRNAPKYKAIGINMYIGQWEGPTEKQLKDLKSHGMKVICAQNEVGLKHRDDPIIIGWMHGDEPDNMKRDAEDKKWIPVAHPEETIADYQRMKKNDPTRPVYLNLGQGVAYDPYVGKWVRDHKTYIEFLKGCDIVSYDIYPMRATKPGKKGKLWLVPLGVDRLQKWGGGRNVVWTIVECIPNAENKPEPRHVKAEVWMSLIHGSTGICYFVHQFKPKFIEAGLLAYPEMAKAVGEINMQIRELAPVLNSPTVDELATATSYGKQVPIDIMVKSHGGATYIFAVPMREGKARATFQIKGLGAKATAEVIGEDRSIAVENGLFVDDFKPWEVHLYKIAAGQ
ncbi:MAG: hypothetical protein GWP05_01270 [Anaerolineaceae bacterium]|nr:hypothetical protein [Anaerolineaceae bacterium]